MTLDEINELKENNRLGELIVLSIKYKDSDTAKPLNDALLDTIENMSVAGNINKVVDSFNIFNLDKVDDSVIFKLIDVQTKYSETGPLIGLLFYGEKSTDEFKEKVESSWIQYIDRKYNENKTACETTCFIYMGIISNKVSLKCIESLAKLGEFSSLERLIVDRFPYITEEFRSDIEKVIKKYDKGVISEIPSILKTRKIVKSEKEMIRQ